MCASGELQSRPNEFKCLQKFHECHFAQAKLRKVTGTEDHTDVRIDASLIRDEYEQVKQVKEAKLYPGSTFTP